MTDHVIELRPPAFEPVAATADLQPNTVRIIETYLAAGQGEGYYTGQPSVFVRLAGCTVGCVYCDTKYSWRVRQGLDLTIPQVLEAIEVVANGWKHVVLTGGEPLEHPWDTIHELLAALRAHDYAVTVETSGTVLPRPSLAIERVFWSVAPKLRFAKSRFRFDAETVDRWLRTVTRLQFKFVCRGRADVDEVYVLLRDVQVKGSGLVGVYIQPMTDQKQPTDKDVVEDLLNRTRTLQAYVAEHKGLSLWAQRTRVPVMVRPQMHVLLYGKRRLV